jgi:hypothetical protein
MEVTLDHDDMVRIANGLRDVSKVTQEASIVIASLYNDAKTSDFRSVDRKAQMLEGSFFRITQSVQIICSVLGIVVGYYATGDPSGV